MGHLSVEILQPISNILCSKEQWMSDKIHLKAEIENINVVLIPYHVELFKSHSPSLILNLFTGVSRTKI